jgi:hypothetical protein
MSNLNYRNPKTPLTAVGGLSLPLEKTDGVTFSVLNSGGYMEVYNLSDLIYQIPNGTIGPVLFSGNTIPVQLNKGSGTIFSPDVLTLSSDNITSGRRRLGMLVFVQEEKQVYQFRIDNYDSLWSAATGSTGPGGPTIVFSQFGTTVKNNTPAGQNLIDAWTGSTIEGYSGGTRSNSNWIKYYGNDFAVTGGSFSNVTNVLTLTNVTGGTIPITGFTSFDRAISAFTYNNANTLIIDDNSGNTYTATIDIMTGITINGDLSVTGNTNVGSLSATTISATTYQNLPVSFDRFVTGFTYNDNTFTIFDNSGSTFDATIDVMTGLTINGDLLVTGITSSSLFSGITFSGGTYYGDGSNLTGINDYFTTGATFNPSTKIGTFTRNDGNTYTLNLSSLTTIDTFVTGFTSSGTSLTISQNEGQPPLTATIQTQPLSGALSSVTFNIVTTGTMSATTFSGGTFVGNGSGIFNAPYLPISGGTVTGSTQFTNGLTANTISATTYQNLPVSFDRFVTGFTYNDNTFTIFDNSGSTFDATINTMTGLTINGNLSVTGTSQLDGGISSLSFTGTTDRIVQVNSGGTFIAVSIYIPSGSTAATELSTITNWDINGNYIGPAITGTLQGQKWYDGNYFYEAIQDNVFVRLIRG